MEMDQTILLTSVRSNYLLVLNVIQQGLETFVQVNSMLQAALLIAAKDVMTGI